jgi:phage shock protein A
MTDSPASDAIPALPFACVSIADMEREITALRAALTEARATIARLTERMRQLEQLTPSQ